MCSGGETSSPTLAAAKQFAECVKREYPDKCRYNCSPSFNWKKHLMTQQFRASNASWARWVTNSNFVTSAGFHALNYSIWELRVGYKDRQMAAYTRTAGAGIRRRERGYNSVKHQAFVGAGYFDEITKICGECSPKPCMSDRRGAVLWKGRSIAKTRSKGRVP